MQFYFVRHGESEANVLNVFANRQPELHPLTAKGRQQAEALAHEFSSLDIRCVYSSPLLRARETAEIIAQAAGAPHKIADALSEFDCGIFEGETFAAGADIYNGVMQSWLDGKSDQRIEGGESFNEIRERFVPFVIGLIAQYRDQSGDIVIVAHGGLFRCTLSLVMSNIDLAFTIANHLENTGYVRAEPYGDKLICREWCGQLLDNLS